MGAAAPTQQLPHWDLASLYSGFDGSDYREAIDAFERGLQEIDDFFQERGIRRDAPAAPPETQATLLVEGLRQLRDVRAFAATLHAYTYLRYSVASGDAETLREQSRHEIRWSRWQTLQTRFRGWVGTLASNLDKIIEHEPALAAHEFKIRHDAREARYLMSEELEALAADLSVDGARAFSRLQSSVTSQLQVPFDRNGIHEKLPITMVRNLCFDSDPEVRERAYQAEIEGWKTIAPVVATSLNSIKGTARTLARRRGRDSVLDAALSDNRIDRATLDALLGSIREALPMFRRYLKAKARKMGQDVLPWWDLFAPLGNATHKFSWSEARKFVCERFASFSPDLASFAERAFDRSWIDAEPRSGKVGGAFCMPVVGRDESRVLVNFDGSLEQLFTLAHELGHAFHNECQAGLDLLLRGSPSTLAETASIFCETLVCESSLDEAGPDQQLAILEAQLAGATQVCLDITCRFQFESAVLERRAEGTLSAQELCDLMHDGQAATYADAIDPKTYHPYMWLWKPHYYSADSNFYNFPYSFGHLFGLGLYKIYREEGESFIPRYRELLRSTGQSYAPELARSFGIEITTPDFWRQSLKVIEEQVSRYEALEVG